MLYICLGQLKVTSEILLSPIVATQKILSKEERLEDGREKGVGYRGYPVYPKYKDTGEKLEVLRVTQKEMRKYLRRKVIQNVEVKGDIDALPVYTYEPKSKREKAEALFEIRLPASVEKRQGHQLIGVNVGKEEEPRVVGLTQAEGVYKQIVETNKEVIYLEDSYQGGKLVGVEVREEGRKYKINFRDRGIVSLSEYAVTALVERGKILNVEQGEKGKLVLKRGCPLEGTELVYIAEGKKLVW